MTGIEHVQFERARQVAKNWNDQSPENAGCELSRCAFYIVEDYLKEREPDEKSLWSIDRAAYVRNKYAQDYPARLRIAAALIAAEIDRIQAQ